MPKEWTHWTIAEETYNTLPEGTLKTAISHYPKLFFLGALLPDIPYYSVLMPEQNNFFELASRLHGQKGSNPYDFFQSYLAQTHMTEADWALLSGAASHVHGDASFHPLVYYYCGYEKQSGGVADQRHHKFEMLLDRIMLGYQKPKFGLTFQNLIKKTGITHKELVNKLLVFFQFSQTARNQRLLRQLLRRESFLQKLISSPLVGKALNLPSKLGLHIFTSFRGLFYNSLSPLSWDFSTQFIYKHPVTGEDRKESLEEILNRAVENTKFFLEEMQETASGDFSHWSNKAPALDTGINHSQNQKPMKHFNTTLSVDLIFKPKADQNKKFQKMFI